MPSTPICSDLEFVDKGTEALVTCVSDRVYPAAYCHANATVSFYQWLKLAAYFLNLNSCLTSDNEWVKTDFLPS